MEEVKEKRIHEIFVVSIILKGFNALLQLFLGLVLLVSGKATSLILLLTQHELIEDPQDFIASHTATLISHLSPGSQHFAGIYLLSHGIIKIVLVWALLKNKIWAYPATIISLVIFIGYQIIRYTETHSIPLIVLTVFDLFVLWLVSHEYRYLMKKKTISKV